MRDRIPDAFLDLFAKRAFGHLATPMPDGSPQLTPVWVDYDGRHLLVNSRRGRRQNPNVAARPRVAIEIQDPDDPSRYLSVRGRVVEVVEDAGGEQIDRLARRSLGLARYPWGAPGEVREIFKMLPERVVAARIG